MDQNPQGFEEKKNILEKQIADTLLVAVQKKQIPFDNLQTVSKEILVELEPIKSFEQLIDFLDKISQKWPFFSNLLTIYKTKTKTAVEEQVINKLSNYIKTQN